MNPYIFNEGQINIPSVWADHSLNIFKLPATKSTKEASFIISRDYAYNQPNFSDYISTQLAQCEKQLPGYRLINRHDYQCQGYLACWLDYLWKSNGQELMLRQVFVERKPAVLIFTLTTTPADAPNHEPEWKQVMGSLGLSPHELSHK